MAPYVNGGHGVLVHDGFLSPDSPHQTLRLRGTLDYGLTDQLAFRTRLVFEDGPQEHLGIDTLELGGIYELAERDEWPVDVGLYAAVFLREDGRKDNAYSARLLLAKQYEKWNFTGNVMLVKAMHQPASQTTVQLRLRSLYQADPAWAFGAEYFGGMGTLGALNGPQGTTQRAGPMVNYTFKDSPWHAETTALLGLNDRSDDLLIKWRIGYSF